MEINEKAPLTLGTESVGKLLMQYAMPAIIAMTASSLYNITDSIFIGHGVGLMALTGLTVCFPLMNLAAAFGSLVGVGASSLLSIRIGQKDYRTANHILGNVLSLNLIMGLLFAVPMMIFLKPILIFFGASEHSLPHAYDFMMIILAGNVFTHMYFGLNALLRSVGHPKRAMMATIYTVLINLVLNPLFIFVFKWGIQGSAYATIIAQFCIMCWQIHLFNDKNFFVHWQKGIYKLQKKIVTDSLSIGLSPFLMNAASCLIVVLIIRQLTVYGGDVAVSAYGIVNRVSFLFVMIVMGINQGMQPIAGYNYGAKLYPRVFKVLKLAILFATVVMAFGSLFVEIFPHWVSSVFANGEDLKALNEYAIPGLRWVFAVYALVGFQIVTSAFFQSIGKPAQSIILSTVRQMLLLVPFLLILPHFWQMTGVWASITLSDFLSIILSAILLHRELKTKKHTTI